MALARLQQVADGKAHVFPSLMQAAESVDVAPRPGCGALLIGEKVPGQPPSGEIRQSLLGKTDPAVFPDARFVAVEKVLQQVKAFGRQVAASGTFQHVFVIG